MPASILSLFSIKNLLTYEKNPEKIDRTMGLKFQIRNGFYCGGIEEFQKEVKSFKKWAKKMVTNS
jgi:hypothetical protein